MEARCIGSFWKGAYAGHSKSDDTDALALLNQAKDRLNAEKQRLGQLTRPKRVFDSLCEHYQDAGLFAEHEFKTSRPAKEVAAAIVNSLTNAVGGVPHFV